MNFKKVGEKMGLLQKAIETYDCSEKYIGVYKEGYTVLAPISHIVTKANIEIVLDIDGNFVSAVELDKNEPKIIIPVTEDSAGRTSKANAHPLCDNLGYISSLNDEKHKSYLEELEKWEKSQYTHPILKSVLIYVKKEEVLSDLKRSGLEVIDQNNQFVKQFEKMLVRWRVLGVEEEACWKNKDLMKAYIDYCETLNANVDRNVCMISGKESRISNKHLKGIVPINGNAKLISANDSSGYTYRGRFKDDIECLTISYEASQKAHNALKWIIENQSVSTKYSMYGNRTFICWNPRGRKICPAAGPFMCVAEDPVTEPTDYMDKLKRTLQGYKSELPEIEGVVIAAFDAATSGRLSLTYYNELMGSDFLERLYQWDRTCCWHTKNYGIQAPLLYNIINYSFGVPVSEKGDVKFKTDDRILKQQMQRIISCRIDGVPMPGDILEGLVKHASLLKRYSIKLRENLLSVTCAVIKKFYYDKFKEEWKMVLEPNKKDRSYQFGRLLAVFEKIERDTYGSDEKREPLAIRQQTIFCQRPMYVSSKIEKQLERAYFPRLNVGNRIYMKKLIGEIMEEINEFSTDEWNKPLKETYLMGYYLQRNELYKKRENNNEEEV